MVSDGYWLRAPDQEWCRVKLEDYLTAAGNAGFYAQPTLDGYSSMPPQRFVDVSTGLVGTTIDPSQPVESKDTAGLARHHPGVSVDQLQQAQAALSTVHHLMEFMAARLLDLGKALSEIADVYRIAEKDGVQTDAARPGS